MKTSNKLFIALSLLIYFTTMSMAQVTHIFEPETANSSEIIPKIRIEDNQLFAITPNGVYSQELDEFGNLVGESLSLSELFINIEFDIRDLLIRDNDIFVVTSNRLNAENAILSSNNSGETWTSLNDWSIDYSNYIQRASLRRGERGNSNEFFLIIGYQIIRTEDFGKTWKYEGITEGSYLKSHPLNSEIAISQQYSTVDILDNQSFMISYDYGKKWEHTSNFVSANDVAFHNINSDIIALVGDKVIISKDCGKTWEVTKNWGYENKDLYLIQTEFDTRGSDRLYATRSNILLYSDDFGANWNELCVVGESSSDYIANFVQQNDKIYTITKEYKVYEVDLELLESSVEEVAIDNGTVSVSVVGNSLQINSKTPISMVEIYNISGVKLHSSEMLEGAVVDISALTKGTYVARLYASNGNSVSIKFNK